MQLVEPGNLTLVHLQTTLGHVAHATLRLLGTEHGQIVQERGLGSDLEVPDRAVTLATEVDNVGVGVKEGQQDAAARVQLLQGQRLLQVFRVPQRHLPLTHAAEAGGQDLAIGHKHSSHGPGPLVGTVLLRYNGAFAGLNDANSLVPAGGADEGAVSAPVHAVDCVRVHVRAQRQHGRPSAHVPHQDHVVTTCTEQHVLGRGVPGHDAHALGVALQGDDRLPQGQRQAPVRDLPHHDRAIFGATGNDVIIVRAPGDVQHGRRVATDHRRILVHTASLAQGQYQEGPAPAGLTDQGHELGVDSTEATVPGGL